MPRDRRLRRRGGRLIGPRWRRACAAWALAIPLTGAAGELRLVAVDDPAAWRRAAALAGVPRQDVDVEIVVQGTVTDLRVLRDGVPIRETRVTTPLTQAGREDALFVAASLVRDVPLPGVPAAPAPSLLDLLPPPPTPPATPATPTPESPPRPPRAPEPALPAAQPQVDVPPEPDPPPPPPAAPTGPDPAPPPPPAVSLPPLLLDNTPWVVTTGGRFVLSGADTLLDPFGTTGAPSPPAPRRARTWLRPGIGLSTRPEATATVEGALAAGWDHPSGLRLAGEVAVRGPSRRADDTADRPTLDVPLTVRVGWAPDWAVAPRVEVGVGVSVRHFRQDGAAVATRALPVGVVTAGLAARVWTGLHLELRGAVDVDVNRVVAVEPGGEERPWARWSAAGGVGLVWQLPTPARPPTRRAPPAWHAGRGRNG